LRVLWTSTGAILGCTGVIIGAYSTHKLRRSAINSNIDNEEKLVRISWCETAMYMQMIHSTSLLLLSRSMTSQISNTRVNITGAFTVAGVLLFSGSLYIKALAPNGKNMLKSVTPIGGWCFILSWLSRLFHVQPTE